MKKTPYSDEFDPLPMDEIGRLLRQFRTGRKGGSMKRYSNVITIADIERETKLHHTALQCIMENRPLPQNKDTKYFGRKRRQKLSRWLLKASCGMIVKRDGKIVYLEEPTKPMPVVRRVSLGLGGPTLTTGTQHETPRLMPRFSDLFKVPKIIQLPKGLK
jgi:hypothetical protein